jgi:diguanylate cyclase (GGDEF)-like protein
MRRRARAAGIESGESRALRTFDRENGLRTGRANPVAWLCLALLALLASATGLALARDPAPAFEAAYVQAPLHSSLEDILSGKARVGFTPLLTPGMEFATSSDQLLWVRIRTELPPASGAGWRLGVARVPLNRLQLRVYPPGEVVAREGFFLIGRTAKPWPATFEFELPAELEGKTTLYLQIEGEVRGGLHLRLRSAEAAQAEEAQATRFFRIIYGLLLLVAALSVVRHVEDPQSGALAVGGAALAVWLACLGINGHIYSLPEVALLAGLGATVPQSLLLLGAGPLVLATRHYSGLDSSAPGLVPWMRGLGWALIAAAIYGLLVTSTAPSTMQWAARVGYSLAGLACLLMLLLDARQQRWIPLVTLMATSLAVLMRVFADRQALPATLYTLHGWQLLLALTVMLYLLLPWWRALRHARAMRLRAMPPEPTAGEKIAIARERLVQSLASGLKNAADGDLEWIAFRRLMEGLKPVLPQISAAVVAIRGNGEQWLQVDPPDAEPRYRELLAQRSSLLKNLSRLRTPQQVGMDFDGPEGPLAQVQLAVIPLPVPRPGWGAVLVERQADVTYSDAELALCAEFAAVAIRAGEEASDTVSAQREADTDPGTGALRPAPMQRVLVDQFEIAQRTRQPMSVLHLVLDQQPALVGSGGAAAVTAALRLVATSLREECEPGDTLGRAGDDGMIVVAVGKRLIQARDYAERLRTAISRMPVDPRIAPMLTVSIGIAQADPADTSNARMLARALAAAQIAAKNGGNQIFS